MDLFALQITKTTVDLTVDPVALLAFLVATASFAVSIIAIMRDRAKIKIEKREGWIMYSPNSKQASAPKLFVTTTNIGRRPIYISNVGGLSLRQKGGFIFSDSVINGTVKLEEGQSFDCSLDQKEYEKHLSKEGVDAIVVRVSTGKEYRLHIAPLYKRIFYSLKKRFEKDPKKA